MGLEAERYVRELIAANKNLLVPFYLSLSYLYYEKDEIIVGDDTYGIICDRLFAEWDEIEHFHKHLVEREALKAGTGYHLKYPDRVAHAAWALYLRFNPPAPRARKRRGTRRR